MNISRYGKFHDSKQNRINVKLVKTGEAVLENSDEGLLKSMNIFDETVVALTSRGGQFYWDTPTLVGACIFDLAEFHMYEFIYKVSIRRQNHHFHPKE